MSKIEVSPEVARRALLTVHGIAPSRQKQGKSGVLSVFEKLKCVQSDPIDVAGRNADLTLRSRVEDYRSAHLSELLYKDRKLFEYFCKMQSILPIGTFPIFRHRMAGFEKRNAAFFKQYSRETKAILKALERGPTNSHELEDMGKLEWGWGRNAMVANVILTRLWVSGKLMIHHRKGAIKYYSLTEDTLPPKLLSAGPLAKDEDTLEIVKIIVRASRLASASNCPEMWWEIGKTSGARKALQRLEKEGELFSLKVKGYNDMLYALIEDEDVWRDPPPLEDNWARFLAPLDPMLWNRALFKGIFGMEYAWEVYKKPPLRKYGYYCLPILFNGRAVGLIDPFFRKKDRALEIRNMHRVCKDIDVKRYILALDAELHRFCEYLGAEALEFKGSVLKVRCSPFFES